MKKKFYLYFSVLIITITLFYFITHYLFSYRTASEIISEEKKQVILQAENQIQVFHHLLSLLEKNMQEKSAQSIIKISQKLKTYNLNNITPQQLKKIAQSFGVDEIYLINNQGIVFNTSFTPDLNFDLFQLSTVFKHFLLDLIGQGKIASHKLTISNNTGKHNIYSYFSPPGRDYIIETSLSLSNFTSQSAYYYDMYVFLFKKFFQAMTTNNHYLKTLDIYHVTTVSQWSILNEGKKLALNNKETDELRVKGYFQKEENNSIILYQKLSYGKILPNSIEMFSDPVLELKYNQSNLATLSTRNIVLMLLFLVIITVIFILIFSKFIYRQYILRILLLNTALKELKTGNLNYTVDTGHKNDELDSIAKHINELGQTLSEKIEHINAISKEKEKLSQFLRQIMDSSPDAIFIHNLEGEILDMNNTASQMYQYPRSEMGNLTLATLSGPSYSQKEALQKIDMAVEKKSLDFNWKGKRKDGSVFPNLVRLRYFQFEQDEFIIAEITDTTELLKTERALEHSLQEKEVLLREIHHRIKNNFQIISGLLYLQSHFLTDEKSKNILMECQNRVLAMALVHQKLYNSPDLSSISTTGYFEELIFGLQQSYRINPDRIAIELDFNDTIIPLEKAIPLGLILHELFTNALKHAFTNDQTGQIQLQFFHLGKNLYQLIIADNGKGLPEGISLNSPKTLGLMLVDSLIQQLNGKAKIVSSPGTRIEIIVEL